MADDGPSSAEQPGDAEAGELVLFTTAGDVRPNVLGTVVFLALAVGAGWAAALPLRHHAGGTAAAVGVGLPALWLANRHLARIVSWLRRRRRPLPAMRLTASGLDYSPAYTGDFPLHVDWLPMPACRYRQGADNTGFLWCLYSPIIDGTDPLPPRIHREWPLDAQRARAELRDLIGAVDLDKDSRSRWPPLSI